MSSDGGGDIDANSDPDAASPDGGDEDKCGGDSIALEDFVDCYKASTCERLVECDGRFEDVETCLASLQSLEIGNIEVIFARIRAAIEAGEIEYDAEAAVDCATFSHCREGAAACELTFFGDDSGDDECFLEEECPPGGRCDNGVGDDVAVCVAGTCIAPVGLGDECGYDDAGDFIAHCGPGDHCVDISTGHICTAGILGDTCMFHGDCDRDLYCDAVSPDPGTCQPDKETDATCEEDEECPDDELCVSNGFMPVTGICQRPDEVGDKCDGRCYGALLCEGVAENVAGTCQSPPGDDEACAPGFPRCGPGLFCDQNDVCQEVLAPGETCQVDITACGPGLFCDGELTGQSSGLCVMAGSLGAPCFSFRHCESGVCTEDMTCGEPAICHP